MFIPLSVGGRGVGVGGSGQCTIVWGGKLFISTSFPVTESVFCLSFKFWLNFRFFKIHGFDLIFFFCFSLRKTLKLIHKLHRTVGCQNPKFQNFTQSILASTTFRPEHYQNREKVGKTPVLPIVQTGQTQALARFARSRLAVLFWWWTSELPWCNALRLICVIFGICIISMVNCLFNFGRYF